MMRASSTASPWRSRTAGSTDLRRALIRDSASAATSRSTPRATWSSSPSRRGHAPACSGPRRGRAAEARARRRRGGSSSDSFRGGISTSNAGNQPAASRAEARSRRHTCEPLCREVGALHGVGRLHRESVAAGASVLRLEPQLPRLLAEHAALRDADSGARDGGDPLPDDRVRHVGEVVELLGWRIRCPTRVASLLAMSFRSGVLPPRRSSVTTQRTMGGPGLPSEFPRGPVSPNVSPNAGDAPSPGSRVVTAEPNMARTSRRAWSRVAVGRVLKIRWGSPPVGVRASLPALTTNNPTMGLPVPAAPMSEPERRARGRPAWPPSATLASLSPRRSAEEG